MRWIWRRKRFESEMDAEIRMHIESYTADLIRSGVSPGEAERQARMEFGSIEASKDDCRQARGLQLMDELRADLRLAFRTIRHSPGFAAISVLSLALGIGANTAIFGVFDVVMLRLMPVRDPGQLIFVYTAGTQGRDGPPYPLFELIRDHAKSFEAVAAFSPSSMELTADRGRELARGVWVSGNFYEMLGVRPLMGRGLTAADDQTSGRTGSDSAAAVISRAFWQQRFAGDPAILGKTVYVSGHAVSIVGVMPNEIMTLEPGQPVDIAVPIGLSEAGRRRDRTAMWLFMVARLKQAGGAERARAESDALFRDYMAGVQMPSDSRNHLFQRIELAPAAKGLNVLRNQYAKPLAAMMILAGLVLLAACVNMTGLMIARAAARQRDFAVRLAIGASRGRLIRQNVTEALVLVGISAALGMLLAQAGETALAAFFAENNRAVVLDLSLNVRVLCFTLGLTSLCGLAVGIVPAVRAARLDPAAGLHGGGSRSVAGSRGSMKLSRALVMVQVALSMVLLAGAGLFIRTLQEIEKVDLGFNREGVLTVELTPEQSLQNSPEWMAAQPEILERVRRIPAVRSAALTTISPMSGRDRGARIEVPGFVPQTDRDRSIHMAAISPAYFETLGVPLLLGREFAQSDHGNAPRVAILNEAAARFYFGSGNPIGGKVRFTNYPKQKPDQLVYEVVGVVRDSLHDSLREQASRFIYLPIPQFVEPIKRLTLDVRCSGDALALAASVRREIQSVHQGLLIAGVSTIEKQIGQTLMRERLVAMLATAFGTAALLLASIGLYGILAYAVTRRTNEIGIRMALGATRSEVVWMVLREGFALAGAGILLGVPVVLAIGQVAKASLFGVEPFDPMALAGAAVLLLVWTVVAAVIPGRRASLLDPSTALRRDA